MEISPSHQLFSRSIPFTLERRIHRYGFFWKHRNKILVIGRIIVQQSNDPTNVNVEEEYGRICMYLP